MGRVETSTLFDKIIKNLAARYSVHINLDEGCNNANFFPNLVENVLNTTPKL
jgi:hypothetical protein